jgi:hypothetical protein
VCVEKQSIADSCAPRACIEDERELNFLIGFALNFFLIGDTVS